MYIDIYMTFIYDILLIIDTTFKHMPGHVHPN